MTQNSQAEKYSSNHINMKLMGILHSELKVL